MSGTQSSLVGIPASQALPIITQYEDNAATNSYNYAYNNGQPGADGLYHTASGYFQITNTTWQQFAGQAGVDTTRYPTAISAPYSVQAQVATAIYNQQGFAPWANYDPKLASAIATGNTTVDPQVAALSSGSASGPPPGATYENGVWYNADGTLSTYDGSPASTTPNGPTGPGTSSPGAGAGFGSVGQAVAGAATAPQGIAAVAQGIAEQAGVVFVGLALLIIGLVWALLENKLSSATDIVRSVRG